jgi:hypothetical protein
MADQATLRRDLNLPSESNLTDRIDRKIIKVEQDLESARVSLEEGTLLVARSKKVYDGLHDLTGAIENLAPMIRDEVAALERRWLDAELVRKKLEESHTTTTAEVKSAHLARKQLQQIGLYSPSK